jgi:uncharacterized protein GlcG (DUF336 family)
MDIEVIQHNIGWEAAQQAVESALSNAAALGLRVCAAVVDAGGNRVAFGRMNGAPLHSIAICEDKAYTAASFGLATGQWLRELERHSEAVRRGILHCPRFVIFGGGVPFRVGDRLIGAIGVSGGSEAQDEECALAGVRAIGLAP